MPSLLSYLWFLLVKRLRDDLSNPKPHEDNLIVSASQANYIIAVSHGDVKINETDMRPH